MFKSNFTIAELISNKNIDQQLPTYKHIKHGTRTKSIDFPPQ